MRQLWVMGFCLIAATALAAERQPFERYQEIVDRHMFGPEPEGFDPTKPANAQQSGSRNDRAAQKELSKEEEKLKNAVRFSVINISSTGDTMVGFSDNTDPKAPKHYFLKVGDTQDGWFVKEADPVKSSVTLVKDEFEIPLTLGGATQAGQAANKAGGTPAAAAAMPTRFGGSRQLGGGLLNTSLRGRRALRQQQEAEDAAARAERERMAADEKAEREKAEAEERATREQEQAETRDQLKAIQEELKRAREEKARQKESEPPEEKNESAEEPAEE